MASGMVTGLFVKRPVEGGKSAVIRDVCTQGVNVALNETVA